MEFQKFGGRLDALAFQDLCAHWSRWKWILLLTTASSCVECSCPGCPGSSAVISQHLDSAPMASNPCNPTMSPHTGTSGHPSHYGNSGQKKKRKGETSQKLEKHYRWKHQLKTKNQGRTTLSPTLFQIAATLRPHDLPEPVQVYF